MAQYVVVETVNHYFVVDAPNSSAAIDKVSEQSAGGDIDPVSIDTMQLSILDPEKNGEELYNLLISYKQ